MAISKYTREFIDSQIDYYISEASSYRQIAEEYVPEVESVHDTAFGMQDVFTLDSSNYTPIKGNLPH